MAIPREKRPWIAGLVAGAGLMLAPVLGVAGTVIGLVWSFRALDGVDPSMKAQQLAEGIHHAMWSTAIGLAFVPFGVALFGFSLFRLLRSRTTW